jgi:NurA-like 5'-3' nuclease
MAKFFETLDRYLTESSEFVYTKRFFAIEYSGVMVLKAPEEFDDANPTYFVKTKYENDLKDYYRKKGIQDSELISIFGLMKSNLSDRSQDIFREKDNAVKWGECLAEQNPKKLKALIESTHIHQLSGDDKYDELENLTKYGNLKQGKDTLMHFREKHIRALKILDAAAGIAVAGTPAASRQGEWDIGKPHKLVTEQT